MGLLRDDVGEATGQEVYDVFTRARGRFSTTTFSSSPNAVFGGGTEDLGRSITRPSWGRRPGDVFSGGFRSPNFADDVVASGHTSYYEPTGDRVRGRIVGGPNAGRVVPLAGLSHLKISGGDARGDEQLFSTANISKSAYGSRQLNWFARTRDPEKAAELQAMSAFVR